MILAIDPGTTKSAYVVFDRNDRRILEKGIIDNNLIVEMVAAVDGMDIYIEMIASYGMAVGKETFETCVWIGRFIQEAVNKGIYHALVYRKDVKMHLCGSVRAKDANIRQALIDLLGKDKTKGVAKDMWAALGVAVTVAGIN